MAMAVINYRINFSIDYSVNFALGHITFKNEHLSEFLSEEI